MRLFFEDLHIEVTEQDEPPKTWKDHGQYLIIPLFYNVPYFQVFRRG